MKKRPNSNKSTSRKSSTPKKKTSDESNESTSSSQPKTRKPTTPAKTVPKSYTMLSNRGAEKISLRTFREIRFFQKSTHLLIPKAPFGKLVREILQEFGCGLRVQAQTLEALQEATEYYLIDFLMDSYICTLHAKRRTLMATDMKVVRRLRGLT